jgi:deoxyguanosine kinase
MHRFIAIEGPTGVGKTTLATRLAMRLDATAVLDPFEDNPFLPQLLTSAHPSAETALRVELTFVALRVAQLRQVATIVAGAGQVVADWALLKQAVFAAATLDAADTGRMAATVDLWAAGLPTPDLLIGLDADVDTLRARIRQRGRRMEAGLSSAELAAQSAALDRAYRRWPGPLIRLDTDTFDVFNDHHLTELVDHVHQLPTLLESR